MTEVAVPRPSTRTPAYRLGIALLLGLLLSVPLFSVYLLVYDRQAQSTTAHESIVAGWGASQTLAGPFLRIPYHHAVEVSSTENGQAVTRSEMREDALYVAPADLGVQTRLDPQLRRRSIYAAVIYLAHVRARGSFLMPDLASLKIDPASLRLDEAEIAVAIGSAKGLAGSRPMVMVGGRPVALIPKCAGTIRSRCCRPRRRRGGMSPRRGETLRSAAASCPPRTRSEPTVSRRTGGSAISRSIARPSRSASRR